MYVRFRKAETTSQRQTTQTPGQMSDLFIVFGSDGAFTTLKEIGCRFFQYLVRRDYLIMCMFLRKFEIWLCFFLWNWAMQPLLADSFVKVVAKWCRCRSGRVLAHCCPQATCIACVCMLNRSAISNGTDFHVSLKCAADISRSDGQGKHDLKNWGSCEIDRWKY